MNALQQIATPHRVKLTVDDYLLLDREGALAPYGRTELVDGVILAVSSQFRPHSYAKAELAYRLRRALEAQGSSLYVGTEASVAMPPHNMPQPDVFLTSEPRGEGAVPLASVALIVEVSTSTLEFDRGDKAATYAAAGVPELWVVDVKGRVLYQMWAPGTEGYLRQREVVFGERMEAATVTGLVVETEGLA